MDNYGEWQHRNHGSAAAGPTPHGSRWRVLGIAVNAVVVAIAAILIGHVVWRTTAPPVGTSAPSSPNSGNNSNGGSGSSNSGVPGFGLPIAGAAGAGSGSSAAGGPTDASSIAKGVDAGLVDINDTLAYEHEEAAGTGMVLTPSGEVLTNNHVIEQATSITATDVGNGKTYSVRVLGYDRTKDVALLQLVGASGLETVHLGDSSSVQVGASVVGIGNAGGAGGTPSYAGGAVASLDQSITASDEGDNTSEQLNGLIGTNADIQPGDSGGPLVNSKGRVIGMDTAASSGFQFFQNGSSSSQGFAIPIDDALTIANEIKSGASSASVHVGPTAFLGVQVASPQSSLGYNGYGSFFGAGGTPGANTPSSGAQIVGIVSSSPAAGAGLVEGDTITAIGARTITSPNDLTAAIESLKPGASTTVTYIDQNGQRQAATVHLVGGPPQ